MMRRFGRVSTWRRRNRPCRRKSIFDKLSEVSKLNEVLNSKIEESPPRAARRFVPRQSVTVAVNEDGFPLGCGVVRDLSESGACLVTELLLKRGWRVDLRVSLDQLGVFEAKGHIVWSGEAEDSQDPLLGAVLHGVQFTGLPDAVRSQLKSLLTTAAFDIVPTPVGGAANRTPFQEMLEELQPELDRLGEKLE